MKKRIVLLLSVMIIFDNPSVFADGYSQTNPLNETILEDPYKSARLDKVKYIDGSEVISKNVSSIYKKSSTVAHNLNINKILNILKKTYENIKIFLFKVGSFFKNSYKKVTS
jgi:hypothetical protein